MAQNTRTSSVEIIRLADALTQNLRDIHRYNSELDSSMAALRRSLMDEEYYEVRRHIDAVKTEVEGLIPEFNKMIGRMHEDAAIVRHEEQTQMGE